MTALRAARSGLRPLAVLLALAAVVTAAAPGLLRIQPGDTLWAIAGRYHTDVATLRALNHLPGNGLIYAGQLLRLPGSAAPGRAVEQDYVIRPGDSLTAIAARFGTTVRALQVRNALPASGLIWAGRHIAVPAPAAAAARRPVLPIAPPGVQNSAAQHRRQLAARRYPAPATIRAMVAATAGRMGVDRSLALAVAYQESGFQQGVVSSWDAIGVMQVLPSTGAVLSQHYGRRLDLMSAADNITAGVLLLRELVAGTGAADKALAGYYQGLGSVAAHGVLPQTAAYVHSVLALRARFR